MLDEQELTQVRLPRLVMRGYAPVHLVMHYSVDELIWVAKGQFCESSIDSHIITDFPSIYVIFINWQLLIHYLSFLLII